MSVSSDAADRQLPPLSLANGYNLYTSNMSMGKLTLRSRQPAVMIMVSDAAPALLRLFVTCLQQDRLPTATEIDRTKPQPAGEVEPPLETIEELMGGKLTQRKPQKSEILSKSAPPIPSSSSSSSAPRPSLTSEQQGVLDAVASGSSVFFTGSAGTGKSLVLQELKRQLNAQTTAFTASTGIAATAIGGVTLQGWAGLTVTAVNAVLEEGESIDTLVQAVRKRRDAVQRWTNTRTLVCDEISMVDGDLFDLLDVVGRRIRGVKDKPWGGIQLVLSGDFFQLPPVGGSKQNRGAGGGGGFGGTPAPKKFAFKAKCWPKAVHKCIELTQVFRQADNAFVTVLNEIRWGRVSAESAAMLQDRWAATCETADKDIKPTKLHTHRADVESENSEQLKLLPGETAVYKASDTAYGGANSQGNLIMLDASCPAAKEVKLKVGAQVILTKTLDQAAGLVNGARGIVTSFQGPMKHPVVKFVSGAEVVVRPETWTVSLGGIDLASRRQVPLDLAWALSIHKSQGLSLDAVEMSLAKVFECGQAYVALSRARSLLGLVLNERFNPACVRAHPDVIDFYTRMANGTLGKEVAASSSSSVAAGSVPASAAASRAPSGVPTALPSAIQSAAGSRRGSADVLCSGASVPTAQTLRAAAVALSQSTGSASTAGQASAAAAAAAVDSRRPSDASSVMSTSSQPVPAFLSAVPTQRPVLPAPVSVSARSSAASTWAPPASFKLQPSNNVSQVAVSAPPAAVVTQPASQSSAPPAVPQILQPAPASIVASTAPAPKLTAAAFFGGGKRKLLPVPADATAAIGASFGADTAVASTLPPALPSRASPSKTLPSMRSPKTSALVAAVSGDDASRSALRRSRTQALMSPPRPPPASAAARRHGDAENIAPSSSRGNSTPTPSIAAAGAAAGQSASGRVIVVSARRSASKAATAGYTGSGSTTSALATASSSRHNVMPATASASKPTRTAAAASPGKSKSGAAPGRLSSAGVASPNAIRSPPAKRGTLQQSPSLPHAAAAAAGGTSGIDAAGVMVDVDPGRKLVFGGV